MNDEARPILLEDAENIRLQREKRKKKILVGLLTTVVTVGLCLGIALPLSLATKPQSKSTKSDQLLTLKSQTEEQTSVTAESIHQPFIPIEPDENSTKRHHHHHRTTSSSSSSEEEWTTDFPTRPTFHIPDFCARLNNTEKDFNLESWLDRPIYEVARIQLAGTPVYSRRISCSTVTYSKSGEGGFKFTGKWEEGGRLPRHRCSRMVQGTMERTENRNRFDAIATEPEEFAGVKAEMSLVAEIAGYLMTYECYPHSHGDFDAGYAIFIYRKEPDRRLDDEAVALLTTVANKLRLNPQGKGVELVPQPCLDAPPCEDEH